MASKLFDVFNAVENGRQQCLINANAAGLPTNPEMTISSIASLFLMKNNNEDVSPTQLPWERPIDWPDTKTILANAEDIDGYGARYIVLLDDTLDTTRFYKSDNTLKNTSSHGVQRILTSDGAWIDISTASYTHTWDKSKDIEGDGKKYRWFIGYKDSETLGAYYIYDDSTVNDAYNSVTNNIAYLEMILGNCKTNYFGITGLQMKNFEVTPGLTNPEFTYSVDDRVGLDLKQCNLTGITKIIHKKPSYNIPHSSGGMFTLGAECLMIIPDLEEVDMKNVSSGGCNIFGCCKDRYLSAPKLKRIYTNANNYSVGFGDGQLYLDLPELEISESVPISAYFLNAPKFREFKTFSSTTATRDITINYGCNLPKLARCYSTSGDHPRIYIGECATKYGVLLSFPSLIELDYLSVHGPYVSGTCAYVDMPGVTKLGSITIHVNSSITATSTYEYTHATLNLPLLEEVGAFNKSSSSSMILDRIHAPLLNKINSTDSLNAVADTIVKSPPNLLKLPETAYKYAYRAVDIILPEGCIPNNCNWTNSKYLSRRCLLDVVNKLADVTNDPDNTYTLTVGTANKAKLSEEEWQPAIDKGWVIK